MSRCCEISLEWKGKPKKLRLEHYTNNFFYCTVCSRLFSLDLKIFLSLQKMRKVHWTSDRVSRSSSPSWKLSFSCTSASPRHPRFIVSGELAYKFKLPASVRSGRMKRFKTPTNRQLDCSLQILSRRLLCKSMGFRLQRHRVHSWDRSKFKSWNILSNAFIG